MVPQVAPRFSVAGFVAEELRPDLCVGVLLMTMTMAITVARIIRKSVERARNVFTRGPGDGVNRCADRLARRQREILGQGWLT